MAVLDRVGAGPRWREVGRRVGAFVVAAGALAAQPSLAQETRPKAGASRTPLQWVQSVQQAALRVNYSGTIVYQADGAMNTSRITHLYDGTHSRERVQTLDGKPREFIRLRTESNDEVQCLIPETRRIVVEHRAIEDPFPGLTGAPVELILQHYALKVAGLDRVAGVECQQLVLEPKDAMRYGYRLCVDPVSGLLLRAQTVGDGREVLEQIAFAEIRIGERIERSRLKPAWSTEGWTVERSEYRRADLAQQGWVVPVPSGFIKTKEVIRRMGSAEAMQVVFSDGLATVSVFIEPAADSKALLDQVQTMGPTSAVARRVGNSLVTVIGEMPPTAVRSVVASVEYRAPR
ncbi:MAG: MucB/RseB C-terminal domain-containing protein [Burkholderiaceae bacterium]